MNNSEIPVARSSLFPEENHRYGFLRRIASGEIYWAVLTTGLAVLYVAVLIFRFYNEGFPGQQDDPYINYAYIDSFLRGDGLVFNKNEYVWGFTSPLQILILVAAGLVGLNVPHFADCLGIFWLVIWSVLLFQLFRSILPPVVSSVATLLLIFGWQEWSMVALESNLLITCQLAFLLMIVQKRPHWAGFFAALACLARPDSVLLVVPLLLLCRETRKLSALAAFAIPGVLWLGFSWFYYDAIVPQSFHAKVGMTTSLEYLKRTLYYIVDLSVLEHWLMITGPDVYPSEIRFHWFRVAAFALLLVSIAFCNFFNKSYRSNNALIYLIVFPWLLLFAYSIIGSHPDQIWQLYSAHFFFQFTLLAAIGYGIVRFWKYLASGGQLNEASFKKLRWGFAGIAAVIVPSILYIQATSSHLSLDKSRTDILANGGVRYKTYKRISDWINHHVEKNASIAMVEIGIIGYFTDVRIVDHEGIVTPGARPSQKEKLGFGGIVDTFQVDYLLVNGDLAQFRSNGGVEYQRVKYFPEVAHLARSLLKRVEPGDN